MDSLTKIRQKRKRLMLEVHLKTLADTSMYTGIHSWDFTGPWPVYKPQKSLVDFFIKSLGKLHNFGLNASKIAKGLNRYNIHNILYAENQLWIETDILRILAAPESGLVIIN